MVKFTNIVALGLVLAGISTTASPVINEQRDIERRTTSLSCGWAKKDGVDMGCMCNLPGLNLNLDLGGLNILSLGLKQYPPGCKPTCDDKVYECPHGSNGHGGCNEPMACPPNHCESYGKCCPYGTTNMNGVCCPKGCVNKDGRCYVPHPEPQCPEHSTYSQHEKKCVCDNHEFEMFDHKCVPKCDTDKKRNDQGHCECKEYGFKPDEHGVCRPQCTHPKELDLHENRCECPEHLVDDGKGGCKTPPPTCYHPKKLNDEKNACVCKEHLIDDGMGGCKKKPPVCTGGKMLNYKDECVCPEHQYEDKHGMCFTPPTCTHPFVLSGDKKSCVCEKNFYEEHGTCKPKPVDCGWGKKWCKTKCCRNDQEEKDNGVCGCPHGTKEGLLGLCSKIGILGINL